MGWRVSWYKADKNEPLIITHEVGNYDDEWDEVKINGDFLENFNTVKEYIESKINE